MAAKRPFSMLKLPAVVRQPICLQCRFLHAGNPTTPKVPRPTPFVPDPQTFLTLIGRNMAQHAAKIPTWEALFTLSSAQLRESGVEPARARRYLLWWRERFRNGLVGIGGDLTEVEKGVAELRIVEVPSSKASDQVATLSKDPGTRKVVVNTKLTVAAMPDPANPVDNTKEIGIVPPPKIDAASAKAVKGIKIVRGNTIGGTGVEYIKGHPGVARLRVQEGLWEQRRGHKVDGVEYIKGHPGVARLRVQEGLWEQRRGHKVDGGERRQAEVRAKRRAQERKDSR